MPACKNIKSDYRAARRNDPAIPDGLRGVLEVMFCTPGFLAVTCHRGLHFLHTRARIPVLPRFLSLIVRWWTGVEIHPGAEIGSGFFIDHGAGVVIGETTIIGSNVTLFQGVTLGGTGNEKTRKRHPTLEDNVFVGSGAKILGPITIGSGSRIGANSVVLKSVPKNSTVAGMRARIVKIDGQRVCTNCGCVAHEDFFPAVLRLEEEIRKLKKEIRRLSGEPDMSGAAVEIETETRP